MKKILAIALTISIAVAVCLGLILRLATPENWPIPAGTLKAKKIQIDGQPFIMIEGESMNYLGQIQSINLDFDQSNNRIFVSRCLVRWNPFNKIIVNNQWPVLYSLDSMKPGKYSVIYKSSDGEQTAGIFDVP